MDDAGGHSDRRALSECGGLSDAPSSPDYRYGAGSTQNRNSSLNKVMLFVMAIAIHNLPEGLAAGVGFGTEDVGNAITVRWELLCRTYRKEW